jgi:oxygen-independent coproporphyrinogen-3 oxidase
MERNLRTDLPSGTGPGLSTPETISETTPGASGVGRRFRDGPPPLALYVHLPWCVRKCPYCDFNSHAVRKPIPETRYVDALLSDLDAQCALLEPASPLLSVFIGGGTPSLFSGAAIARLLDGIRACCGLAVDAEITLETNPGTVDSAHFEGYARAGVNRLSIGVQSLSADHLARLGRIHDPQQARAAVRTARAVGIENLNLDMMFGLPAQSLSQAQHDLQRLIALAPEHISYYQLTLEPNTAFAHRPPLLPDHDLGYDMQEQGLELLAQAGYRRYEVSAFAKADWRCRHNLNYWRFGDYIGIGAGSHGKLTDARTGLVERRACTRHPDAYLNASQTASQNAGNRLSSRRRLSDADLILEFALNTLRLVDGVEGTLFERRTGLAKARIEPIICQARADGLLTKDSEKLAPTAVGLRFLNDLIGRFEPA